MFLTGIKFKNDLQKFFSNFESAAINPVSVRNQLSVCKHAVLTPFGDESA